MPLPIRAIRRQFDPRRIAGCNLWIDFSDRSTITITSDRIQQVNDKSGGGLHLSQGTASNRPSLSTFNGLTCGDWGTATNTISLENTTSALNIQSAMIVAKWDQTNDPASDGALFTARFGNLDSMPFSYNTSNLTAWIGVATYQTNIWLNRVATLSFLPAMRNNAAVVQGHSTSSTSFNGLCLGCDRLFASRGWQGRICEVVCYSRQITTDERNWLAYEVAKKWGIAP